MDVEALAEKVAEDLFKNYQGRQVQRLVLTDDDPKRDWGGWGFKPAVDRIAYVLRQHIEKQQ